MHRYPKFVRLLGPDNPKTLWLASCFSNTLFTTGAVLKNAGKVQEGLNLSESTYLRKVEILGRDHPSTLIAGTHHGNNLGKQKHYAEALPLLQKTLKTATRVWGQEHERTLQTAMNLVTHQLAACNMNYDTQGQAIEAVALALGDRTLELQKRVLGPEHQDTMQMEMILMRFRSFSGSVD